LGIALAAAATATKKMREFNRLFRAPARLVTLAAPGFRIGDDAKDAVEANPGCDGVVLGGMASLRGEARSANVI